MSTPNAANYLFFPWVREGAAAGRGDAPATQGRAPLAVSLGFAGGQTAAVSLQLYGPGDVNGIDPRQVIRTDPQPGALEFEPNYFAAVEFDEPALPWLLSPGVPDGDRLQPWLCLVVVRADRSQLVPGVPLPRLQLGDAAEELPDLADAWAWAHAQLLVVGDGVTDVAKAPPERTLSRLLSTRRLEASTAYRGCVVPTYRAGVEAGLGRTPSDELEPAWPMSKPIELPVYYSWEFSTGPEGDFVALARRLRPYPLSSEVGQAPLDLSVPGGGLPATPGASLSFLGALHSPSAGLGDWPDSWRLPFRQRLTELLTEPEHEATPTLTAPRYGVFQTPVTQAAPGWLIELNLDPRWRAAAGLGALVVRSEREQLLAAAWEQAGEVRRANAHLRHSQLALSVATRVFDKRVRSLPPQTLLHVSQPAHARLALSDGATLRNAIARSVLPSASATGTFRRTLGAGGAIGRRIATPGAQLSLTTALAAGEVTVKVSPAPAGTVALADLARAAAQPSRDLAAVDAPLLALGGFRRLSGVWSDTDAALPGAQQQTASARAPATAASPESPPASTRPPEPVAQQQPPSAPTRPAMPVRPQQPAARPTRPPTPDQPPQPQAVTTQPIQAVEAPFSPNGHSEPGDGSGIADTRPARVGRVREINQAFNFASAAVQQYLTALMPTAPAAASPPLDASGVARQLQGTTSSGDGLLHPARSLTTQATARLDGVTVGAELDELRLMPSFPQPMVEPLRAHAPDLLLPGAGNVPTDTVGLLEENRAFLEAYLVGLNHELARELLFADYPLDPSGTAFRQFWATSGELTGSRGADVPPIAGWDRSTPLGGHTTGVAAEQMVVLLIRGTIALRYPRVTVYAVPANPDGTPGTDELYPTFRGTLPPDFLFLGFAIEEAAARGDNGPGWFFVLQQQPTEPRFALEPLPEPPVFGATPADAQELSWGDLVNSKDEYKQLFFAPAAGRLAGRAFNDDIWGTSSAAQAAICLRKPIRVAMHGAALLPPTAEAPRSTPPTPMPPTGTGQTAG